MTEDFLADINAALAPGHEDELRPISDPLPSIHVIGVPRSGTTLTVQLCAAHLDVGYINRLTAAFWKAPLYGIRLSRMLLGELRPSEYQSRYGATRGIHEPHEFGFFWRDLLGHHELAQDQVEADQIDWDRVALVLGNIAAEFARPVVYKPFMFGWLLSAAAKALPEHVFVWVRRDPVATAMSLLRFRDGLHGDRNTWGSMLPAGFESVERMPPPEQVAEQVFAIESAIEEQVEMISGRNVVELRYERLCADPAGALARVESAMAAAGTPVVRLSNPPASFEPGGIADGADPDYQAVVAAVARRKDPR